MISFSQRVLIDLVYSSVELTCGTLIIKIKNSICACSFISRVFIYASNQPLCDTLINNLGKISICACYCKQKDILCKNKIGIQNMSQQFTYEQLYIYIFAQTTEIKLLRFYQLIIYRPLLSCQIQCIKFKPHVKTLFLEQSLI